VSRWRDAAGFVVGGVAAGAIAALLTGTPLRDAALLFAFAVIGSGAATLAVFAMARRGRARSLRARLWASAIVSTAATVTGVVLAAEAMFISAHDLGALLVVIGVAAAMGGAGAVLMGGRIDAEVAELEGLARRLADLDSTPDDASRPAKIDSPELSSVADELARARSRLVSARRRERALDASRRELVAWVSHDLRSPIASIRAMAEALEDGVVDDPASVADYHRAIRAESERLGSLVDDLFELSRITSGVAATGQAELVPLDEVLNDVVEGATGAARARGVALAQRLATEEPPLVPADLRRVLRNLVDNAISATAEGGTVTISGHPIAPTGVALDVTDECGGIDEHHLPRLFDVGYRADTARRRDGGAGLGLAIARGLLEAHAGQISVINEGPGCRFTVHLPDRPRS
jgi:signal transduction histidine kinase